MINSDIIVDSSTMIPQQANNDSLLNAINNDDLESVFKIIDRGMNLRISDNIGNTPLHVACRIGNLQMIQKLLADPLKADINAKNNRGQSPLCLAVANNHRHVVEEFIKHHPTTIDRFAICFAEDPEIRKLLFDPSIKSDEGRKATLYTFFGYQHPTVERGSEYGYTSISATHILACGCKQWKPDDLFLKKIGKAYDECVRPDLNKLLDQVKNGEITFLETGYRRHGIYMSFFGNYLCIINRGIHSTEGKEFSLFRFDRTKMTREIADKLLTERDPTKKSQFIKKEIIQLLYCTEDEVTCKISEFIKSNQKFKTQNRQNCSLANAKPLLFFAKIFEKSFSPTSEEIKESYTFFKEFTKFTRKYVLKKLEISDSEFTRNKRGYSARDYDISSFTLV